jgi:hypothetical protein
MRVTIKSVLDPASGLVEFQSELGASRGRWWAGPMPVPGTTYFVEVDVNKVLTVGTDFVYVDDVDQPSIGGDGDRSVLIGILERIDDDFVIFRLGKCLIMLEVEGAPLTKGACVRVGPVHLSLSDMMY